MNAALRGGENVSAIRESWARGRAEAVSVSRLHRPRRAGRAGGNRSRSARAVLLPSWDSLSSRRLPSHVGERCERAVKVRCDRKREGAPAEVILWRMPQRYWFCCCRHDVAGVRWSQGAGYGADSGEPTGSARRARHLRSPNAAPSSSRRGRSWMDPAVAGRTLLYGAGDVSSYVFTTGGQVVGNANRPARYVLGQKRRRFLHNGSQHRRVPAWRNDPDRVVPGPRLRQLLLGRSNDRRCRGRRILHQTMRRFARSTSAGWQPQS